MQKYTKYGRGGLINSSFGSAATVVYKPPAREIAHKLNSDFGLQKRGAIEIAPKLKHIHMKIHLNLDENERKTMLDRQQATDHQFLNEI